MVIVISGCVLGATTSSMVYLTKYLFEAFETKNEKLIYLIPAIMCVSYLVRGISRYIYAFLLKFTLDQVLSQIRIDLQRKFLRLNLTYHFNFKTGGAGLLSQTLNDVSIVGNGFMILADAVREPVTIAFVLASMLWIDWKLTLATYILLPLVLYVLRVIVKGLKKHSGIQLDRLAIISSSLKETLDGIRIIQSFNLESQMRSKMQNATQMYLKTRKSILRREEASAPILEMIAAITFAGISIYIGTRIMNSQMNTSDFIAFVTALFAMQPSVKKLQEGIVRSQQCVTAMDRVVATLADESEVKDPVNPKSFPHDWQQIEFRNVSFRYKDSTILKNLNFTIQRGEQIAMVGESGSGKSTIINLLMRFFEPNEGQILIGGTPIQDVSLSELRHNLSFVSQDVFLFNDSIAYNIKSGDFDKNLDPLPFSVSANAHSFIERLPSKYETIVGERGNLLSGGEKQRISIARAFYKDAPLLILDEATSALDSVSEGEVQKGLDRLMSGRTSIVIAHRLSTIVNADRILVLKNGEIVEEGTHKQLLERSGEYHRFYELQARM